MRPAKKRSKHIAVSPRVEGLEDRLLLTTLHGGDFFIYYNSQGEAVRVVVQPDRAVRAIIGTSRFYDPEGVRLHG